MPFKSPLQTKPIVESQSVFLWRALVAKTQKYPSTPCGQQGQAIRCIFFVSTYLPTKPSKRRKRMLLLSFTQNNNSTIPDEFVTKL
jgi:hypothetical protein